jgi:3-methyl-2-oxobutanoate hydroxymethyltransferase
MRLPRIRQFQSFTCLSTSSPVQSRPCPFQTSRAYSVHPRSYDDSTSPPPRPKVTLANLRKMYMTHQKLAVMTAHDFPSGTFADRAGSDIVLVGDSLGMVCLGYESTNLVTLSVLSQRAPIVQGLTNAEGYDTPF